MARNLKSLKDLTVVTNSIMVVNALINSNVNLIILGGKLKNNEQIICSSVTMQSFENYYVDKAFFSCGGITGNCVTDYGDNGDILNRHLLAEHTQEMILLADSGKFGRYSKYKVFNVDLLDKVVVDTNIDPQHLSNLHDLGVEVLLSPVLAQTNTEE